ncbi:1-phosphofructokinase [Marinobacter sp. NP-4(2019)]|uniref:1-phosphofructokinase n=1 Tax=Marinobacter sp. NP-4(2019) TaxID=2488665 RepID=UPI000FC3F3D9|nr:1-phosphofructokinase [Marinobacter sp. NP-4(2019)]AZT82095.1 1-phosphofructokinase [Marinobacter sp. NP-4(2019)]
MARVLCITLNPALDLTAGISTVTLGSVNRADDTRLDAAGKGINVARVLAQLGHSVTVSGFLGKDNAAAFERLCADESLQDEFVRVPGQNRINLKITEQDGRVTELNGPGFEVTGDALTQLERRLALLIPESDAVVIGGSLPGEFPESTLATLIAGINDGGKPVWLDTSGKALKAGVTARPEAVKPNIDELADWAGGSLDSLTAVANSAVRLQESGISQVIVSMGPDGVLWLRPGGSLRSVPPSVSVASTVGAGDTLLAGMVHGCLSGHAAEQVLAFATALSVESVQHVGVGNPAAPDFHQLLEQTRVLPWLGENNNGEMPL